MTNLKKALLRIVIFILIINLCAAFKPVYNGGETPQRMLYGLASFYAEKFHGKATASGETFSQNEVSAACNVFPLGTWLKVTNLKNNKFIIVKTNDRLHPKTKRIIDLSLAGAKKLDYVSRGLTRVKIEVVDPS